MSRIAILADFPIAALDGGAAGRGAGQGCTWLPQLALEFQRSPEFEIHWLILDRGVRRTETIHALGQRFHRLPAVKVSVDLATRCLPARYILGRAIRRLRPDVVHAWGTELIYPAALQDCRCPSILSMQGVLTEYQRIGGLPDDWRWRRMVAAEPGYIRSATVVTCESKWGIDRVKAIHPQADCRMVEYGVHPDFYAIQWQPDPQLPYVLYIGGSGIRKGLDVLFEAMKLLPDRSWELRLAGDEGLRTAVANAGINGCRYLGLLPWPEMRRQLQGAWCTVLPTRGDTSPNSVKEARVVGVPVVTSIHGGQAGYISDGVNGRVVEPLDAGRLAAALADVMSSHERALALGGGSHQEDRSYLHPVRTTEGFAKIYKELSAKKTDG